MRRRNMYYATGMPGWMRLGYSPGWGGVPPCAPYVAQGQFAPQDWDEEQGPVGFAPPAWGPPPPEVEMQMLQGQLQAISEQLQWVTERLEALGALQDAD